MNFSVVSNKRKSVAASPLHEDYTASGARLTMYQVPPIEDVALEEFEQFALDRLRGTYLIKLSRAHRSNSECAQKARENHGWAHKICPREKQESQYHYSCSLRSVSGSARVHC